MAPKRIGPYRILRLLGEGGMGAVFEAVHTAFERRVALKVLHAEHARHPDAVQRFFNEARAVNRIEHPNIVQISEFGQDESGTAYLVMEFLRGQTLSDHLEALSAAGAAPMSPLVALPVAAQLADALAAAHEKGIVHRDLKPANVMLLEDPLAPGGLRVKLLDFGIAKLTQGSGKATTAGAIMGTAQYMSPEQCQGASEVDDRTDVYSLGVMLYEMLAGRPPFVADSTIGYMGQHAFREPPPLLAAVPNLPADVAALVHQLLVKDKTARPTMQQTRAALLRLFSALSGGVPAVASPLLPTGSSDGRPPKPPGPNTTLGGSLGQTVRSHPERRRAFIAGAAASALAAAGLLWWLKPSSQAPSTRPTPPSDRPPAVTPTSSPAPPSMPEASPKPSPDKPPARLAAPSPAHRPEATADKPSSSASSASTPARPRPVPTTSRPVSKPEPPKSLPKKKTAFVD